MTEKYEHVTYGKSFSVKCKNEKDIPNVMNFLITGHTLAGQTMQGVEYEILHNEESEGAKALRRAMIITQDSRK